MPLYLMSGDIIPAEHSVDVHVEERQRLIPPQRASWTCPPRIESEAMPVATREDEHAVSTTTAGPPKEKV